MAGSRRLVIEIKIVGGVRWNLNNGGRCEVESQ